MLASEGVGVDSGVDCLTAAERQAQSYRMGEGPAMDPTVATNTT